jgi:hypothetical protein
LKTGDKILDRMKSEIHARDKLLIILSENSIGSKLVETEVLEAIKKERQVKRTVLFPIRLDDKVIESDAAWIEKNLRGRVIIDFHDWTDEDTYQKQFARLLRDLRAVDAQEVDASVTARPPKAQTMPAETYRASIRKNLVDLFDDSELRDLCFDMGVEYESLRGEAKSGKARELLAWCERRERVSDLVAKCKELRPKVSWEGEYE